MIVIFIFLILPLIFIPTNADIVTVDLEAPQSGLANQLMAFQCALHDIKSKYHQARFLIIGPKSQLIPNCYGKHKFFDFFRLRDINECENFTSCKKRQSICKDYMTILASATDTFSADDVIKAKKLAPVYTFCMPWPHKSTIGGKFHCPQDSIPEYPFFFELFDFHSFIHKITKKFLTDHNLNQNYTTVHYRAGNFKGRKERANMYHEFNVVENFAKNSIKSLNASSNIYYMAQFESDIPSDLLMLRHNWLKTAMKELQLDQYLDAFEFIRLLVDLNIASKANLIIGNHYSTLSEMMMSLAELNDRQVVLRHI